MSKESTEDQVLRHQRKPSRTLERLAEDDANIAALEKKLGIKKGKKLPNSFASDGLENLLGSADEASGVGEGQGAKRKREQDGVWLKEKRRKTARNKWLSGQGPAKVAEDETLDNGDVSSEDQEWEKSGGTANSSFNSTPAITEAPKRRENPYVPPLDPRPSGDAPYRTPSLRQRLATDVELNQRLRRQTQGLLNRLSESNVLSVLGEVEKLYQTNPRQYTTDTLIDLVLAAVCDSTVLTDTFVILHAGFVAAIYKVLGPDFGAQMIETVAGKVSHYYDRQVDDMEGKQVTNLIAFLAQLYNFQVIGCTLVFDYIRLLLGEISELNTELLLRIIRCKDFQPYCSSQLTLYSFRLTTTSR